MAKSARAPWRPQYLEKAKLTRGIRPVGEVFAMKFRGVGYLFGMVIRNDCAVEPLYEPLPWKKTRGLYLVYVYKGIGRTIADVPELHRDRLLIAPQIIIGAGWSHGYFTPVRQHTLTTAEVRAVHCFANDNFLVKGKPAVQYVDEYGNRLRRRSEPCDVHGIGSFGTIERDCALALGLPYRDI